MIDPSDLMRLAVDACRRGMAEGQSPFGCAIALGDRVIAQSHNTVVQTTDITAHAEVNAIREACLQIDNIFLSQAIVATTCEPCPMCMSALHWARVDTVYYGATIADAEQAGFNELQLSADRLLQLGGSQVQLVGDTLADTCRRLFSEWMANPKKQVY